jgi:hypothetical protein
MLGVVAEAAEKSSCGSDSCYSRITDYSETGHYRRIVNADCGRSDAA